MFGSCAFAALLTKVIISIFVVIVNYLSEQFRIILLFFCQTFKNETQKVRLSKKQVASRNLRSGGGKFEGDKPRLNEMNHRGKPCLSLPLGETSRQLRGFCRESSPRGSYAMSLFALSVFAALSHLSQGERQDCQKSLGLF